MPLFHFIPALLNILIVRTITLVCGVEPYHRASPVLHIVPRLHLFLDIFYCLNTFHYRINLLYHVIYRGHVKFMVDDLNASADSGLGGRELATCQGH